jgi:hypothetical protein
MPGGRFGSSWALVFATGAERQATLDAGAAVVATGRSIELWQRQDPLLAIGDGKK